MPLIFRCTCHILFILMSCHQPTAIRENKIKPETISQVKPGAEQPEKYLHLLAGKKVALVVNQTSMVGNAHLVDFLLKNHIKVTVIFAPEHGYKGDAADGEHIKDEKDAKSEIKIVSLYGNKLKPSKEDLLGVDVLVFDIQDVGARFYTYISSLHYIMESCAELKKPLLLLDRPNPNGHYVDGPVLDTAFRSFIGMHPVPVVYGMTIGEYGMMINGEHWLSKGIQCNLQVVPCKNYDHYTPYTLPVRPSPNLPNQRAILLYPSLCFLEGTSLSLGRGTDWPFQIYGHPDWKGGDITFTPVSRQESKHPPLEGKTCQGIDLRYANTDSLGQQKGLNLSYLIDAYNHLNKPSDFFRKDGFFNKLAGNDKLIADIKNNKTEAEIKAGWEDDLTRFKKTRKKYLLYP